jgi:hypothetical protein
MGRGRAHQEMRRAERARVISDDVLWHMTYIAVVSFFDLQDGHIDDRAWTERVYASLDLPSFRTGITCSMRARGIWNDTHRYLSDHV